MRVNTRDFTVNCSSDFKNFANFSITRTIFSHSSQVRTTSVTKYHFLVFSTYYQKRGKANILINKNWKKMKNGPSSLFHSFFGTTDHIDFQQGAVQSVKEQIYIGFQHGRRKVHDYFLLLLCKSSIRFTEKHIFKIIIYFFDTSKCATNYVISFEVYDGFIDQKILKL